MINLGIMSFLQLTLLPGLIAIRWIKLTGVATNLFFAFSLSPIINFFFVFFATGLGGYTRTTVLLLLIIELACLLYWSRSFFKIRFGELFQFSRVGQFFVEFLECRGNSAQRALYLIVFFAAVYQLLSYVVIYTNQINSVFTAWDPVVSWDRWAVDWYNNHFPIRTWHYPQLIPANWSLSYQIIGDERIKFFAKNFMYFFEIFTLLIIIYVAQIKRQLGYFAGTWLTGWILMRLGSNGTGYVDTATAFFGLASLMVLFLSESMQGSARTKYVLLGAVLASGSALTKQAGLWIVFIYPVLYIGFVEKGFSKQAFRSLAHILFIFTTLLGVWYGYKEYQIRIGADYSEVASTTLIAHQGRDFSERLQYGMKLLDDSLSASIDFPLGNIELRIPGTFNFMFILLLMLFGLRQKYFRWLFVTLIIPFFLMWVLFFSYDTRNLGVVLPIIGLTAGMGLQEIIDRIPNVHLRSISFRLNGLRRSLPHVIIGWIQSIRVVYAFMLLIPLFLFLPVKYPDSYLIDRAIYKQKQIGDALINANIYEFHAKHGLEGKILTDYQFLGALPGLQSYFEMGYSSSPQFIQLLERPEVAYALVSDYFMAKNVKAYVHQRINDQRFKVLFEAKGWQFLSTCRGPC